MIPTSDIWIAAVAVAHGATLVTNDAHFNRVTGLTVIDCSQPSRIPRLHDTSRQ